MMFLQFFIWGAWYATGGNYMKSHGMTDLIYQAYFASSIGAIVSPFFMGFIADRFFPAQKVLGVMHILSGIFIFSAPFFGEPGSFSPGIVSDLCIVTHVMLYADSESGIGNGLSFIEQPGKKFSMDTFIWDYWMDHCRNHRQPTYYMRMQRPGLCAFRGLSACCMGFYSFTLPNIVPRCSREEIFIP